MLVMRYAKLRTMRVRNGNVLDVFCWLYCANGPNGFHSGDSYLCLAARLADTRCSFRTPVPYWSGLAVPVWSVSGIN
jgi:hypothetical protein